MCAASMSLKPLLMMRFGARLQQAVCPSASGTAAPPARLLLMSCGRLLLLLGYRLWTCFTFRFGERQRDSPSAEDLKMTRRDWSCNPVVNLFLCILCCYLIQRRTVRQMGTADTRASRHSLPSLPCVWCLQHATTAGVTCLTSTLSLSLLHCLCVCPALEAADGK